MSVFARLQQAVRAFNHNPVDMKAVAKQLDNMIQSGQLETQDTIVEKQARHSKLDVRHTDTDMAYSMSYGLLADWVRHNNKQEKPGWNNMPPRGDPSRDYVLAEIWKGEPILAGAVYSMTAKMASLKWHVTGKRLQALKAARIFSRAAHMGGYDWGGFIASTAEDFYTTNRGVFWETAKDGNPLYGKLVDLGHIDSLCCTLTGNSHYPMVYVSELLGQKLRFRPGEFIHFASMSSPRESELGMGTCAVDRAYRAAKLLMGMHDYDDEKLSNLPPEGVAAVTGLTMEEFQDALRLWKVARESNSSLTFPQVLWLIGSQPGTNVDLKMIGFSSLPESFDRKVVIDQYVAILALDFGVDAREFWPISSGAMGTASESEIQHMKAKGKGPGEFISNAERHINGELPEDVDFHFDTQDIEEDANAAAVAKAWVDAYLPLYNLQPAGEAGGGNTPTGSPDQHLKANPRPNKPNGAPTLPTTPTMGVDTGDPMESARGGQSKQAEQVIDKDQFMRLLVDKGVLPDWMVNDQRVMVEDTGIHNEGYKSMGHPDDCVRVVWDKGILKEERLPPIVLHSRPKPAPAVPAAQITAPAEDIDLRSVKQALEYLRTKEAEILGSERNIHGEPIPEQESTRGSRITAKTLHDELERWRAHPILSKYALSEEQERQLLEGN